MKYSNLWLLLVGSGIASFPLHAQISITPKDMFNVIGQYYRAYGSPDDTPVTGLLGNAGGPQAWDFTAGPTNEVFRFDYVPTTDGGHGAAFPEAKFAERKTTESDGMTEWLYLTQKPGTGRLNYGFYSETFSPTLPETPFAAPIIDFPEIIRYQDSWTTSTSYQTEISIRDPDPEEEDPGAFALPAVILYKSTAVVDAYGIVNQPKIGFGECLRVNELVQYDIQVDLLGEGQFQTVATEFVRNFYWLRQNYGIAVQITSKHEPSPPPDNFSNATMFLRLFETNHGTADSDTPEGISDLKLTLAKDKALLNWTKLPSASTYRIEAASSLGPTASWVELGSTTANFFIDNSINQSSTRFYRIVALK